MDTIVQLSHGIVAVLCGKGLKKLSKLGDYKLYPARNHGVFSYVRVYHKKNGKWTFTKLHRLIMGAKKGDPNVDHVNHNGFDNRLCNLRFATNSQNKYNTLKKTGTTSSIYKGVSWHKKHKRWRASIRINGKQTHLGNFESEQEAARAYNKAAKKLHGKFACINEI